MDGVVKSITLGQLGRWALGALATIVTLVVLTYAISWAWHKGQE